MPLVHIFIFLSMTAVDERYISTGDRDFNVSDCIDQRGGSDC